MRHIAVLMAVAIALSHLLHAAPAADARQANQAAADVPTATAPFGLGTIALPATEAEIAALFARLPTTLAGEPRAALSARDTGGLSMAYGTDEDGLGPPLTIQAQDFTRGDFFPTDFTADQFVRTVAGVPDYGTEAFGRDGSLYWVQATTTVGVAGDRPGTPTLSRPVYTLAWGEASSPWLFGVAATSPTGLASLVTAFVSLAGGLPASPPATPSPIALGSDSWAALA